MAIVNNNGNVIAPAGVAPVNKSDMTLLPGSLKTFKRMCRDAGLSLPKGTVLNLDPGFDSRYNRKCVFNAGLKPNIKENKRNRKRPKRGRKRFFDSALYAQRFTIERSFAWEDKFRRVVSSGTSESWPGSMVFSSSLSSWSFSGI